MFISFLFLVVYMWVGMVHMHVAPSEDRGRHYVSLLQLQLQEIVGNLMGILRPVLEPS